VNLAFSVSACASLGGNLSTVADAAAVIGGNPTTEQKSGYSVEQFTTPAGTRIREYVAPDGTVFGVTWRDPQLPDLHRLLGAWSAALKSAVTASRLRGDALGMAAVSADGAVIFSAGHMGHFRGRAYRPPEKKGECLVD
jgi:hypothetical protein